MSIVYFALQNLSGMLFGFMGDIGWNQVFIAPFITPVLHLYFDLFSGLIQTTIFIFLTMINIGIEAPEEEIEENLMKGESR